MLVVSPTGLQQRFHVPSVLSRASRTAERTDLFWLGTATWYLYWVSRVCAQNGLTMHAVFFFAVMFIVVFQVLAK